MDILYIIYFENYILIILIKLFFLRTVISIEDSPMEVTQEQIFENIRLHKEVLRSVKQQPLEMKRKRRLVNQVLKIVIF